MTGSGNRVAKRRQAAARPVRLTSNGALYLEREARRAVRDQRAVAAAYDRTALVLFALSVGVIAATAILGSLELGSSDVGLLSWIAIAVTGTAWVAGALAERVRLSEPVVRPVVTVTSEARRRGQVAERRLAEASAERYGNDAALGAKRRWVGALMQLVALQAAVVVAAELAAR
jgi:hypothetical protein